MTVPPGLWRVWLLLAGISGAVAVGAGAYGAHGLAGKERVLVEAFRTGVLYHLVHSLALVGAAWATERPAAGPCSVAAHVAGIAFAAGIVLFSGSLYVFGMTGIVPVAGAAPVGGATLIVGWLALAASAVSLGAKT